MELFTRWVLAHRRRVVLAWLLVTIAGLANISATSNALSYSFSLPGMDSYEAGRFIQGATVGGWSIGKADAEWSDEGRQRSLRHNRASACAT